MTTNDDPTDIGGMMSAIRKRLVASEITGTPKGGVDGIMRRIQAELEHRRVTSGHKSGDADNRGVGDLVLDRWQPSAPRLPVKRSYVLSEMLRFSDSDFVTNAYRVLFRRPPDDGGHAYYLEKLRAGLLSKVEILGELRWSPEGLARSVHVDGLLLPYKLRQWRRLKVVGPLIGFAHTLFRLSRIVERQDQLDAQQAWESQDLGRLVNRIVDQVELNAVHLNEIMQRHTNALRVDFDQFSRGVTSEMGRLSADMRIEAEQRAIQSRDALEQLSADVTRRYTQLEAEVERRAELADVEALREEMAATQIDQVEKREQIAARGEALHATMMQRVEELRQRLAVDADIVRELSATVEAHSTSIRSLAAHDSHKSGAHALDDLYAAFEDKFRGSRELVRERMSFYLSIVTNVMAAVPGTPVIDLGSGRGEWLQLLAEAGVKARGVDTNRVFLDVSRALGLDVVESDAVEALHKMAEHSVGVVTAMHLAEHLAFEQLVELIDEAHRVLRDGGLLILETPNPENLQVASHWFYLDPTHRNPLPPEALRWLVEARGFRNVTIERLTAARVFAAPELLSDESVGAKDLNQVLANYRAAPDYAVFAWKT